MDEELRKKADERFERALAESGARDPRDFYRKQLRELRDEDPKAYENGVRYFEEVLLPAVASDSADPVEAWTTFGRKIAEWTAEGRTVEIDREGRSHPHDPPVESDRLILHLPDDSRMMAILVSLPPELSSAQRAAYGLLVRGKRALSDS